MDTKPVMHPATWRTESSDAQQTAAGIGIVAVGLVLAIGFRHFDGSGFTNSLAGFLLGLLLLVIGAGVLIFGGKQVITVDPSNKRVVIEKIGRIKRTKREIRFKEISELYVSSIGDREGGSERYYVGARLTTGKDVALFLGFFEGAQSRQVMEIRRKRLQELLQSAG